MNKKFIETKARLPEKSIPLLRFLEQNGPKTQRELIDTLDLPTRTVRYSIRRLLERGLILKIPNLRDMRSVYYNISPEVVDVESIIGEEFGLHTN